MSNGEFLHKAHEDFVGEVERSLWSLTLTK